MCKHIVCTLLIIGVKDEVNYYLTDLEKANIDRKIEIFTENCIEDNINKILDGSPNTKEFYISRHGGVRFVDKI